MSATVKLSSKLPGETEINGVDHLAPDLVKDPETIRVAIAFLDVSKVEHDVDAGIDVPTIRVRRLEVVSTVTDAPQAIRDLVDRAVEDRTGRKGLPFEEVEVIDDELPEDES
jgi:hypothetical protein